MEWSEAFLPSDIEVEDLLVSSSHHPHTLVMFVSKLQCFDLTLLNGNMNWRETIIVDEIKVDTKTQQL